MSISFKCPECGKHLKAPDTAAGKGSKCPGCGGKVTCPAPAKAAVAVPKPTAVKPPKPSAADPFDNPDDGSPYALIEPDPVEPPPAPATEVAPDAEAKAKLKKGGKGKKGRAYLRDVAINQKGILVSILLQIVSQIGLVLAPPQLKYALWLASAITGLVGAFFAFRLAIKLYNVGLGILLGVLTLVPFVGLIVLFVLNGKATGVLKDRGHHVGFLGAKLADFG